MTGLSVSIEFGVECFFFFVYGEKENSLLINGVTSVDLEMLPVRIHSIVRKLTLKKSSQSFRGIMKEIKLVLKIVFCCLLFKKSDWSVIFRRDSSISLPNVGELMLSLLNVECVHNQLLR